MVGCAVVAAGCVDGAAPLVGPDGAGFAVHLHALDVAPGCFVDADLAPAVADGPASDAFLQMAAAARQMREFQASFSAQFFLQLVRAVQLDPTAQQWRFDTVIFDEASRRSERRRATIALTAQTERTGTFTIRVDPLECPDTGCGAPLASGQGRYDPSVTAIDFDRWSGTWNDDFVRILEEGTQVPLLHRGCDPETSASFDTFLQVRVEDLTFVGVTKCWDGVGREGTCDGVDLTPGAD